MERLPEWLRGMASPATGAEATYELMHWLDTRADAEVEPAHSALMAAVRQRVTDTDAGASAESESLRSAAFFQRLFDIARYSDRATVLAPPVIAVIAQALHAADAAAAADRSAGPCAMATDDGPADWVEPTMTRLTEFAQSSAGNRRIVRAAARAVVSKPTAAAAAPAAEEESAAMDCTTDGGPAASTAIDCADGGEHKRRDTPSSVMLSAGASVSVPSVAASAAVSAVPLTDLFRRWPVSVLDQLLVQWLEVRDVANITAVSRHARAWALRPVRTALTLLHLRWFASAHA
jgi:hypothetical protein